MRVLVRVYRDGENAVDRSLTKRVNAEEDLSLAIEDIEDFLDTAWVELEEESV